VFNIASARGAFPVTGARRGSGSDRSKGRIRSSGWPGSGAARGETLRQEFGSGAISRASRLRPRLQAPTSVRDRLPQRQSGKCGKARGTGRTVVELSDQYIPAGYAPLRHQRIATRFRHHAKQDADAVEDCTDKARFSTRRTAGSSSQSEGPSRQQGQMKRPWEARHAPASFGRFANDLLVGNFGAARSTPMQRSRTANFEATVATARNQTARVRNRTPLGARFGNGGKRRPEQAAFLTAGPKDEMDGTSADRPANTELTRPAAMRPGASSTPYWSS